MDPVASTPPARDADAVARAARTRSTDPAAAAGGVAAKGTSFTKVLQAAAEGTGTRGVGAQVTTAETHTAVDGHRYSRVTAGLREGSYLNTSGNARHGQAFALVERGGRTFHVYGEGADRRVVEVKVKAATTQDGPSPLTAPATAAPATAPAPAGTTTPATPTVEADPAPAADDGPGGLEAPHDDA